MHSYTYIQTAIKKLGKQGGNNHILKLLFVSDFHGKYPPTYKPHLHSHPLSLYRSLSLFAKSLIMCIFYLKHKGLKVSNLDKGKGKHPSKNYKYPDLIDLYKAVGKKYSKTRHIKLAI